MDCQEVAKFLQFYVDGELNDEDRLVLEEHLGKCPSCRVQVDYERRFRRTLRARIPKPTAPMEFRVQLIEAMSKVSKRRPFSRRLVWSSIPAAAALVLVITFTWTVTSGFSPLVEEAVEQHSTALPVDMSSTNSDEVEGWFRAKVDFNVALPRFQPQQFNLVGARLSHLADHKAALVRYQKGLHNYSLFVVTDPGGSLGSQKCQRVKTREFCLTELKGYTVILWRSRGLAYSLVGEAAPPEMLEAISTAFSF